jgi:diaminopropionate ammonia-lyase
MSHNKTNALTQDALFQPNSERAMAFARSCPIYSPTALTRVVDSGKPVWIKDESTRFGLGSFKALGGIYAVAQLLLDTVETQTGHRPEMTELLSDSVRKIAATQTYVCASAGNHGMAVATGAQLFGAQARIYVSEEVPSSFATRLRERGAEACVAGANYEESLDAANKDVRDTGALLLADGSWEGYLKPPSLVMEGYTVMACELRDSFAASGEWPSDVYLQAGVGGMAAAVTHMIRRDWLVQPRIVIVEPTAAECLALSAAKGELVEATGPISNMGRLDCKAASLLAFDTLIRSDVEYQSVTDDEAQAAVVALAKFDLHSTPSGVAGFAAWQRDNAAGATSGQIPLLFVSEQAI